MTKCCSFWSPWLSIRGNRSYEVMRFKLRHFDFVSASVLTLMTHFHHFDFLDFGTKTVVFDSKSLLSKWKRRSLKTAVLRSSTRTPDHLWLMLGAIHIRRGAVSSAPDGANLPAAEADILLAKLRDGYAADPWFADAGNMVKLSLRGGLLMHPGGRVCVPDHNDLRRRVIREAHDPPHSGQIGIQRTREIVQRDFWWPKLGPMSSSMSSHLRAVSAISQRIGGLVACCNRSRSLNANGSGYRLT